RPTPGRQPEAHLVRDGQGREAPATRVESRLAHVRRGRRFDQLQPPTPPVRLVNPRLVGDGEGDGAAVRAEFDAEQTPGRDVLDLRGRSALQVMNLERRGRTPPDQRQERPVPAENGSARTAA